MAFIGNSVQTQGFTPAIDYFSGNGSTVTFTLSRPVASVAQMIVAIDNVIQNPSSSFTVSGNAITFSSAPLAGTNNIWVEYTSLITTYNAISQSPSVIGDITASGGYLASGSFNNTFLDGTIVDYVTGNGRITVGTADGFTIYNGGTSARTALAAWDTSGNLVNTGGGTFGGSLAVTNSSGSTIVANRTANPGSVEIQYGGTQTAQLSAVSGGGLEFYQGSSPTLVMKYNSSGNVGIGTASPSGKLHTYQTGNQDTNILFEAATAGYAVNTYLQGNNAAGSRYNNISSRYGSTYQWQIGGGGVDSTIMFKYGSSLTEAMRIDSSGSLLIGTTTNYASARTSIRNGATVLGLYCSGGSGAIGMVIGKESNDASTSQVLMQFLYNNGSAGLGQINGNGGSQAAFGSYSDIRLKENITDIPAQLENICALRPVEFDYKDGSGHQTGFIAQEMQEVYPEAVAVGQNEMLTVTGWNKTEAYLVKAIQELKAQVDAQAAEIAELKAGK